MTVPHEVDQVCQKAREFIRKRQFVEAIGVYEQLLAADPRDIRAHEGIATAAFLSRDYDRAIAHFKRLCQLDVRRADPLVNLGAVYNRKGDYIEAVRVLRQALSKNRKCAEAYYNLGIAHKGQGQLSMAVSAYKEAVRLCPEMAEAYQNLGNAYLDMGNIQQAVNNYRRALEINPRFDRAQRGLDAALHQAQLNSTESNPFGRLVDLNRAAAQAATPSARHLREMTADERAEDRAVVQRLTGRLEQQSVKMVEELKQRLGPALLSLFHAMTADDKRRLLVAHEELVAALEMHWQAVTPMSPLADELQLHEEQLQRTLAAK
ncbi:MAG: tetratricopeptide repeat protein [Planctomycetaceae bacterium]